MLNSVKMDCCAIRRMPCPKSLTSKLSYPIPSVFSPSRSRSATTIRKVCCLLQTKSRLARNSWSLNLGWRNTKNIDRMRAQTLRLKMRTLMKHDETNEDSWIRMNVWRCQGLHPVLRHSLRRRLRLRHQGFECRFQLRTLSAWGWPLWHYGSIHQYTINIP